MDLLSRLNITPSRPPLTGIAMEVFRHIPCSDYHCLLEFCRHPVLVFSEVLLFPPGKHGDGTLKVGMVAPTKLLLTDSL
jgi:hypothetical protein